MQASATRHCKSPLLVASSNKAVSTDAADRCTYLTTLPLMKTFRTELYHSIFSKLARLYGPDPVSGVGALGTTA